VQVSGIEGNFRIICENVMRMLRENKDSLMAMLEAFVYDPLINWRLLSTVSPTGTNISFHDISLALLRFIAHKSQKKKNPLPCLQMSEKGREPAQS
jgi:phosphatidylinositol kinase/protein kinase (PI-3  family)